MTKKAQKLKRNTKAQKLAERRSYLKEEYGLDDHKMEELVHRVGRELKLDKKTIERIIEVGNKSLYKSQKQSGWKLDLVAARAKRTADEKSWQEVSNTLGAFQTHWCAAIQRALNIEMHKRADDQVSEAMEHIFSYLFPDEKGGKEA